MAWKTMLFGAESPSRRQYLGYGLLYLMLASVMHGLYCDFIPNDALTNTYATLGFLAWGVLAMVALVVASIRREKNKLKLSQALLLIFVGPFMVALFTWLVVAKSVPWLITAAVGDSYEETVTLHTRHSGGRGCHYHLEGGYVQPTFPSYLCISETYYKAHPDQNVQVTLVGQRTILGFRVAHIQSPSAQVPEPGRSK